jgi:hypothetical protein
MVLPFYLSEAKQSLEGLVMSRINDREQVDAVHKNVISVIQLTF